MPVLPQVAGRVRCRAWCYDPEDTEFGWYWALFIDGTRVNGGLARNEKDGEWRARNAYTEFLARDWHSRQQRRRRRT